MNAHDTAWKHLFALPAMVEHLLRAFAPELAARLDFATLEQISPVWTAAGRKQRLSDDAWRAAYADGGGRSLVLLVEFQSRGDPRMASRVLRYEALAREWLRRQRRLDPDGELRVLSLVIHSGPRPWNAPGAAESIGIDADGEPFLPAPRVHLLLDARWLPAEHDADNPAAAVLGIESAASFPEAEKRLRSMARRLPAVVGGEAAREVLEAVAAWLTPTLARLFPEAGPEAKAELERALLALAEDGKEEDEKEKEEEDMTTLERRVRKWEAELVREGRREGRREGLADERALLCRLAARRFGARTGAELGPRLETMQDPERLAEVGDWIVECATGAELLARLGPARKR